MRRFSVLVIAALLIAATPRPQPADPVMAAAATIHADGFRSHITFLADDALEGRGTGTRGYEIAARYVASRFQALGLEPAGDQGTWFQTVPFVSSRNVREKSSFILERAGRSVPLEVGEDLTLAADYVRDRGEVRAPLVFAGYGVTAPELGYDDYAGLDVKGRIVVTLRGAPKRFPNDQRAWHSWSRLKERRAVEQGAIGLFSMRTFQELERAPWANSVRQSRMGGMHWADAAGRPSHVQPSLIADGTLGPDASRAVFVGAPMTLERVFALADSSTPPRFTLPWTARVRTASVRGRVTSPNVAALLPGSDPQLKNEVVVVTAHLDHLGIGAPVNGDSIYNGACDNGSGIAAMLEAARALQSLPRAPKRSVLFLAVTGEEKGLQGAEYFTEHPTVKHKIVANVNLDMYVMLSPIRNIIAVGAEHSTLADNVARAAKKVGLGIVPDPAPEEVTFIRSDQFPFIRKGIPAVFPDGDGGTKEARELEVKWRRERYHQPGDDLSQDLDYASGAKFARFATLLVHDVANASVAPRWNDGDFFGEAFGKGKRK